jgi:glycosyltransferase involved in cell wall biosynthesis
MQTAASASSTRSRVSILLPTFNRAAFLPKALDAIRAQTYGDWELIIVDDGSTDDSRHVVDGLRGSMTQSVRYVWQENAGAYAARNRALDLATSPYIAFYDSDDIWLPQHLMSCVRALDENPDVDWVYGATRIVDYTSNRVIASNTFAIDGGPTFRRLHTTRRGALYVIDDSRKIEFAILHGFYCGLQNSVIRAIRATVFQDQRFHTDYCKIHGADSSLASSSSAEDQLFTIRALKRGHNFGYIDDVLVQYHVHDTNSSASATVDRSVERQLLTYAPLAHGFEELGQQYSLTRGERRALARRLLREYFWHIGYVVFWTNGRRTDAIASFKRGLQQWPWSLRCWKTYLWARIQTAVGLTRS